jgi:bifunctional N-acetylglucosamine-1-phosphate-uridyltransferase/glucosamine-1-phosphate-acetyltransferase GlmU-like protein
LINEINSGIYLVKNEVLFKSLDLVRNTNAQSEYYLTDVAGILQQQGKTVEAMLTNDADEVHGINTPTDLEHARRILLERTAA